MNEEVRYLWNYQTAEPNSEMDHQVWPKVESSMMFAFHPRLRWQTSEFVREWKMIEIYYLPRKTFTDRTDGRVHQDMEKIPLSPNSALCINRRKVASY